MLHDLRRQWTIYLCVLLALVASRGIDAASLPTILVFGDSISAAYGIRVEEGWVSLLQKRLADKEYGYRVVNASMSGETTEGGRARLPRALELHHPKVVVLELGGNDGLRGLPVDQMRENLEAMIVMSRKAGARVLLAGIRVPPNYGPMYTEKFQGTFLEVAKANHVPVVPFILRRVALDSSLMQADGIHPNVAGQPGVLDEVWPTLEPLLQQH